MVVLLYNLNFIGVDFGKSVPALGPGQITWFKNLDKVKQNEGMLQNEVGLRKPVVNPFCVDVNLLFIHFWGGPHPPMSNFNIRSMALHGKNWIETHKFNIKAPIIFRNWRFCFLYNV